MGTREDLKTIASALRAAADEIEHGRVDTELWSSDYVWCLATGPVFAIHTEPPEVLATQISDEVEFLELDLSSGGFAIPFMLDKVASLLMAYSEARVARQ